MYSTRMASDISPADRQHVWEKERTTAFKVHILPLGIFNDAKKEALQKGKKRLNVKTVI